MKHTDLTRLSVRLDRHLNQFALAVNAQGEYPWQQQQREQRNKRMAGAAVGTAGVAAAGYGVKKGVDALKNRYGVASGMDALKVGAYDGAQKVGDYAKQGYGIAKDYGKKVASSYQGFRKGANGAMVMGKATGGMGRGAAIMATLAKMRRGFSSAERLVQLEGVLDAALTELAEREREEKPWPKNRIGLPAGTLAATGAAYGADRAIMNRSKKKYGFTPTRATAYGDTVTDTMKAGKRMVTKAKAHAGYHAEPLVRKAKDLMGLRKVAGLLK